MTEVIPHVGTHKTGTTSIQAALAASRPALQAAGILYPDVSPFLGGRRDAQHELAHALTRDDARTAAGLAAFVAHLRDTAPQTDTILISAEPMYRHALGAKADRVDRPDLERAARAAYLDRLAALFAGFDTEIAIYFRDPLGFAESLFANSVVNSLSSLDFAPYIDRRALRFDYRFQLDALRARFGRVTALSYEEKAAEGLVDSFFRDFCKGVAPVETPRLRTGVEKGAVAWLLREKQAREMTLREVRERWHFALQPEHRDLFAQATPTTFWTDAAARLAFHHRTADSFPELTFAAPPAMPAPLVWSDPQHGGAEQAWADWSEANRSYLAARHRLSLPAYVPSARPSVVVGLSEPQIIAETRKSALLRPAICVVTRNRAKMMAALLGSLRGIDIPPQVEPLFVIVENADHASLTDQIAEFRSQMAPHPVLHATEPELGIPIARNTAVRIALLHGASVLVFVDDDEVVTRDWLPRLIARYRETDLMLIGGPVVAEFEGQPRSVWRAALRRGILHRYHTKNRKSDAHWRRGREGRITIATNNWLADAQLFTKYRITFDESLRFTGGSDTEFHHQVSDRGIPTGWAPGAMVVETVPNARVSLRYQFRRAMEQSRTSLRASFHRKGTLRAATAVAVIVPLRILGVGVTLVALPLTRGKGLIELARNAGWISGRVSGLLGARSRLYTRTTGN